jgi:hypothetical protein
MKLADVMSSMHFNLFAQIALVIALAGFVTRNREPFRQASLLPLADDRPVGTSRGPA